MWNLDDLVITAAYVWIPLQIVFALSRYPRLALMPRKVFGLFILVGLFFFLCGAGHLLRALNVNQDHSYYRVLNWMTALISLVAALFSLPLVPMLFTKLDQNLQDVVRLCEETEESKRKLLTFMSFLCHEIRNPLFAISASLTFLEEDSLTDDQEQTVDTIRQSAELMLRLVNDVLDISKLESGKLEMEERNFDLLPLLQGVICTTDTEIKRKHGDSVKFKQSIANDVPTAVRGDSVRLLQIVYNLLSNANKFTEHGFIEFTVSVCEYSHAVREKLVVFHDKNGAEHSIDNEEETNEFVTRLLQAAEEGQQELQDDSNTIVLRLAVRDSGIGIAPDRVDIIFQPYSQAKMSDYRKHGGTGLGLSIVEKLVRIMGGTIRVSSQEYQGSIFTIHLPMRKCLMDQVDPAVAETNGSDTSRSQGLLKEAPPAVGTLFQPTAIASELELGRSKPVKKTMPPLDLPSKRCVVLVVDDNEMNRKLIGRMLSNFHVEYELAEHGQEALNVMAKSRNVTGNADAPQFGLILMDMQMPGTSGKRVCLLCNFILRAFHSSHFPVVTVMDGVEAIERLRAQKLVVPIVALTANALDEWKKKALQAGATDYETKPILRDHLYAKCQQYLVAPWPA